MSEKTQLVEVLVCQSWVTRLRHDFLNVSLR